MVNRSQDYILISVKIKYVNQLSSLIDTSLIGGLLIDQLNQIKFMLCANNFYQKQMLDMPHKQIFSVQVPGLI